MTTNFSSRVSKTIVHIGLGKTGSTTLQHNLFPYISRKYGVVYNPPEFTKIVNKRLLYSNDDKKNLQKILRHRKILISNEGLVDWNPRNWESAADRLLDLFGSEVHVVITVREPIDYLTSMYVQQIHQGNIVRASDFFLSADEYDQLSPFLAERVLKRFDKDSFDLERLSRIYKDRFKNVYILPLSRLNTLYPWVEILGIPDSDIGPLVQLMLNSLPKNVSYSNRAMRWTFARERLLGNIGLRSIDYADVLNVQLSNKRGCIQPFAELDLAAKIKQFPGRLFKRIYRPWRWWMQRVVDKVLPYEKFTLPEDIIFDEGLINKNRIVVEVAEKQIDELKF
jgi:hypothetical protein